MTVSGRIEEGVRVRFDECGADGAARVSAHLRWAQDVAWRHSELAGFDRAWYAARGMTWLVRCLRLDVLAPATSGQALRVSTEVIGWRRVWARRRSEIRADGPLLATAHTDWVLLGANGQPVRVPAEILAVFAGALPTFEPERVPPAQAPSHADRRTLAVRRQELDPMGHVNHAVYLDWLEEAMEAAGGQADLDRLPRRYRLEYERPAEPGAALRATTWRDAGGDWRYGLTTTEGTELLRASLEPRPRPD